MMELMNSQSWIEFIGNRNVDTLAKAKRYLEGITNNPSINYWVIRKNEDNVPVGIVTFIKRDYLDHWDLGFAMLDQFTRQGFAFEAASNILRHIFKTQKHTKILATTIKENVASVALLEKLGFQFSQEIWCGATQLSLYSIETPVI